MSDDFLTRLYEEEQTKIASAELANFMRGMGRDDLEAFLGLDKLAVAGPDEAELPTSASASEIEASHQTKQDYVNREHEGRPLPVNKQPERAQSPNSQQRDSKVTPSKEDEPKTKEAEAKLLWADKIGRMFAKEAAEKASCGGMEKNEDFTNPAAKAKAKAFAATMKASKGQPLAARKSALQKTEAAIEKKGSDPTIEVGGPWAPPLDPALGEARGRQAGRVLGGGLGGAFGGLGGGALGQHLARGMGQKAQILAALGGGALGAAAGGGLGAVSGGALGGHAGRYQSEQRREQLQSDIDALKQMRGKEKGSQGMGDVGMAGGDMGGDMETTAAMKAKIAARAMKISEGAPEHIKAAAVFMAGREISKLAALPIDIKEAPEATPIEAAAARAHQMGQESYGRQAGLGALGGGLLGGAAGLAAHRAGKGNALLAIPGMLGGAALGAGAGALKARGAKKQREALQAAASGGELSPGMAKRLVQQARAEDATTRGVIGAGAGALGGGLLGHAIGGSPAGAIAGGLGGAALGGLSQIRAAHKATQRRKAITEE
jgi:hypothetical protein